MTRAFVILNLLAGVSGCLSATNDRCGTTGSGAACTAQSTSSSSGRSGTTTGSGNTSGTTNGTSVPGVPTQIQAAPARDAAQLTWGPAPSNGSPITGYTVSASPDAGIQQLGTATATTFAGLTPGVSYTFEVVASNALGIGPVAFSNPVVPFDVPGAPVQVTAVAGRLQATVTWAVAPSNGATITDYLITSIPGGQVTDVTAGLSGTVTGLVAGTSTAFSVAARNSAGIGPATLSNAVTPYDLPGSPGGVVVVPGQSQAQVSWTAPDSGFSPILGYTVTATPLFANGTLQAFSDGGTSLTLVGIEDGFSYEFTVAASNAGGSGPESAPVSATPFAIISTLAGNGRTGFVDGTGGADGGAEFYAPQGVAITPSGDLVVADTGNASVRLVAPGGATTTLFAIEGAGLDGLAVAPDGTIYVTDGALNVIWSSNEDAGLSIVAGDKYSGYLDGPNLSAQFHGPTGPALDFDGGIVLADSDNNVIRTITWGDSGATSTLAGRPDSGRYADGTGGPVGTARFWAPSGVAISPTNGAIYVVDDGNDRIRTLRTDGTTTTLAGTGDNGWRDSTVAGAEGVQFWIPIGIAVDSQGFAYVADYANRRIRKIAADGTTTTVAGNGERGSFDGAGGQDGQATLEGPWGLAVDDIRNVYVVDVIANRLRKIAQ